MNEIALVKSKSMSFGGGLSCLWTGESLTVT